METMIGVVFINRKRPQIRYEVVKAFSWLTYEGTGELGYRVEVLRHEHIQMALD